MSSWTRAARSAVLALLALLAAEPFLALALAAAFFLSQLRRKRRGLAGLATLWRRRERRSLRVCLRGHGAQEPLHCGDTATHSPRRSSLLPLRSVSRLVRAPCPSRPDSFVLSLVAGGMLMMNVKCKGEHILVGPILPKTG